MPKQIFFCKNCNKGFLAYNSNNRKFCSMSCCRASRRGRLIKPIKKCPICNKNITHRWRNRIKFCSYKCSGINRKGKSSWNKGKKLSKEHRKKLKLSHLGKPHILTPEGKESFKKKMSGKNSVLWKGGKTSINKLERAKFRKQLQKKVFERDNYTCQMCGKQGIRLQVDHIQPWAEYVEGRFDINNCRTLCMDCHYLITYSKPRPKDKIWGHNFKHIIEKGGDYYSDI